MKYIYLNLLACLFLFSCTKSSDNPNIPLVNDSTHITDPQIPNTELAIFTSSDPYGTTSQFAYDQNKQIASILTYCYQNLFTDSFLIVFNLSATVGQPSSYDYTWGRGTNGQNAIEHHVLLYDGQNRVVLDSLEYGTTTSNAYVYLINTKITYNAENIVLQHYYNNIGTNPPIAPAVLSVDSIYISNGNVVKDIQYYLGGDTAELYSKSNYTYTTYRNPLFQKTLSNNLAALLFHNNGGDLFIGDFISSNFMSPWGNSDSQYSVKYTTDSTGNITRAEQDGIAGGYVNHFVNFKYQ